MACSVGIYVFDEIEVLDFAGPYEVFTTATRVNRKIDLAAHEARLTASVCTGAFLLAQAGLLNGKSATTHWEDLDDLQSKFPAVRVVGKQRWVDAGSILTSAGISTGIDLSLHLVARLASLELAAQTARQMEFDWRAI
ncbi:MAG: DJ-1/PfpI family protein [Rhodocyclaceae bacterium]|nr:DJ-1/PfpI family protein [Rhodocyclaceae bacterium]